MASCEGTESWIGGNISFEHPTGDRRMYEKIDNWMNSIKNINQYTPVTIAYSRHNLLRVQIDDRIIHHPCPVRPIPRSMQCSSDGFPTSWLPFIAHFRLLYWKSLLCTNFLSSPSLSNSTPNIKFALSDYTLLVSPRVVIILILINRMITNWFTQNYVKCKRLKLVCFLI